MEQPEEAHIGHLARPAGVFRRTICG